MLHVLLTCRSSLVWHEIRCRNSRSRLIAFQLAGPCLRTADCTARAGAAEVRVHFAKADSNL